MDKLITNLTGGFPLTLDDFGFMQNATANALKGILSSFGADQLGAVILSGCERNVTGGTVTISAGYVSIDGEVCYFPAQSYPTPGLTTFEYFDLQTSYDAAGNKVFQGGASQDTYQVRIAQIVLATSVPANHTKYELAKTIYQIIDENTDGVPTGVIVMWSGAVADIPTSYSLCDGTNGTPDLRGRFIVGYSNTDTDFALASTGGTKTETLSSSQIPAHSHSFGIGTTSSGSGGDPAAIIVPTATQGNHAYDPINTSASTNANSGGGSPHNNLPPYYALCFIMKVSTLVPDNNPSGMSS